MTSDNVINHVAIEGGASKLNRTFPFADHELCRTPLNDLKANHDGARACRRGVECDDAGCRFHLDGRSSCKVVRVFFSVCLKCEIIV
jgi:hypothetical protein